MASTARPMPPALCACGCNEELPAVRPPKMRYLSIAHRERVRRQTEESRAYQREYQRAWQRAHKAEIKARRQGRAPSPEARARKAEYNRRYRAAHREELLAYLRAYRLRSYTAQPREMMPPEGLSVCRGLDRWRRLSDWRADAAQDQALAELERAATRRKAA